MDTEMMKYVPITALLVQYEALKEKINLVFSSIDSISKELDTVLGNNYVLNYHLRSVGAEGQLISLRQAFWRYVFNKLQIYNLMSEAKKKEFDKQMASDDIPEFTEENIQVTLGTLTENVKSLMDDTIMEAFEILRPHNAHHKTNTEYAIGKKAILTWMIDVYRGSKGYVSLNVNYNREQYLRSIDNAFSLMDGKGPIKAPGDSITILKEALRSKIPDCETAYIKYRWHLNGNIHLVFKRMDLIAKMNAIGGKGLLHKEAA